MILAFGANLKSLRLSRGMSQAKLAKILGVSVSMIGLYENASRMPSFEVLVRAADHFEVSADYLLGRESVGKPPFDLEGLTTSQVQNIFATIGEFKKANGCSE